MRISVIIPVYNCESYLSNFINQLFNQDFQGTIEYIIVNDCSIDRSLEIIKRETNNYDLNRFSVKIIDNATNLGSAASRNIGLEQATGAYIGWLDADDEFSPSYFSKMYDTILSTNAQLAICDYEEVYENMSIAVRGTLRLEPFEVLEDIMYERLKCPLWNKLFVRDIIEKFNIRFLPNNDMAEDRGFCMKYLSVIQQICYVQTPLYRYSKMNSNSLTSEKKDIHGRSYIMNAIDAVRFIEQHKEFVTNEKLVEYKLISKKNLLLKKSRDCAKLWKNIFPEVNFKVFKTIGLSFKHKLWGFLVIFL